MLKRFEFVPAVRFCFVVAILLVIDCLNLNAQCCATGANLLAGYNPSFSDTFSTVPPGFTNDCIYAAHPVGGGYYYDIVSRNYGACGATPQYDHTTGDSSGHYLWFDTPGGASEANPAVAWMPYNPALPLAQQNLIPVIPNTTYVFSIWVRDLARGDNCISGGAPIAGIRINGVNMGEINLGLIITPCCPQWTLLCTLWNSGNDTTALLKIESRTGNGFTDLGIDDVYFGVQTSGGPTLSLGDTSVCAGESVVLDASLPNASFLWSTGSNDSSITVTTPGQYWVAAWQNSCEVADSINVTLKSFHPITLAPDTTVCSGSSTILNAFMPGASYRWQDGSVNSTFTVTQAGNYTVAITDSGCTAVDSILVSALQVAPVYINADTNVICPNDSALICAPGGYTAYLWNNGAGTSCIYASLQGSYSVVATDNNGCTALSNHESVTVLHPPVISITQSSDSISICASDSVQLCTQPGYALYTWSTGQNANCITARSAGLYVVTVTDFNGCTSTSSDSIGSGGAAAPVNITADKTDLCPGDSAQICAPSGYARYQWNSGDTLACIKASFAGSYEVTVTESGNCTAASNAIHISIYSPTPVTVSVNGDTLTGYNADTYQWLLNGAAIAGATTAVYIVHSAGSYSLQITDANGCLSVSTPINISGIQEEGWGNSIAVYPNPAVGNWQLTVDNELLGSLVEVFDATGRLVFQSVISNQQSAINIPDAASGVYQLRLTWQGYSVVRKLVKM